MHPSVTLSSSKNKVNTSFKLLGNELAQATPVSLGTNISTSTTSSATTTALITVMTATNKSIITVIAAFTILAASIDSGYLIGETTRPKDSHEQWVVNPANTCGSREIGIRWNLRSAAAAAEPEDSETEKEEKVVGLCKKMFDASTSRPLGAVFCLPLPAHFIAV
jgi:hypothetical protein